MPGPRTPLRPFCLCRSCWVCILSTRSIRLPLGRTWAASTRPLENLAMAWLSMGITLVRFCRLLRVCAIPPGDSHFPGKGMGDWLIPGVRLVRKIGLGDCCIGPGDWWLLDGNWEFTCSLGKILSCRLLPRRAGPGWTPKFYQIGVFWLFPRRDRTHREG